jgi:hypothetical protein
LGTFQFTIQVTDSLSDTASAQCAITVATAFQGPIPGGGPPATRCPFPINLFDVCADNEARRVKRIQFPSPWRLPPDELPWDEEWGPVPAGWVPFNVRGSVITPATAAGDVLVCQGLVPTGYDAVLMWIWQIYTGKGFQQGSGDIVWRVQNRLQWLKSLGNMPFALGLPITPVPLTEAELLTSGSEFGYYVNVPNLSGAIQIGASYIDCGMRGYYVPRA